MIMNMSETFTILCLIENKEDGNKICIIICADEIRPIDDTFMIVDTLAALVMDEGQRGSTGPNRG